MNPETFLKMIQSTRTPAGTAAAWWMGQMGLWVKLGETLISMDYYAFPDPARQTPPPVPAEAVRGISLFFGSHDHADHIDRASWRVWAQACPDAKFVLPRACLQSVAADGIPEDRLIGLNDGESVALNGVTVHAVAAAHEFLEQDRETGCFPCLQYIVEGNGVRIYHAGDTLRYEGMLGKLQALGKFDFAILPINGRDAKRYRDNCIGNMTFQEAVDLAGELKPGTVMPGHWDLFAHNSEDPEKFREYLAAKYGMGCVIPKCQETILVNRRSYDL